MQYVNNTLNLDDDQSGYSITEREENHMYTIADCWQQGVTYIMLPDGRQYTISCEKALERLFEYLHLQKDSNVWQVEQEVRIIIGNNIPRQAKVLKKGYYMTLPKGCISKMYIGKYMKNAFKKRLKKIVRRLDIETYEAEPKIIKGNWDVQITKI